MFKGFTGFSPQRLGVYDYIFDFAIIGNDFVFPKLDQTWHLWFPNQAKCLTRNLDSRTQQTVLFCSSITQPHTFQNATHAIEIRMSKHKRSTFQNDLPTSFPKFTNKSPIHQIPEKFMLYQPMVNRWNIEFQSRKYLLFNTESIWPLLTPLNNKM